MALVQLHGAEAILYRAWLERFAKRGPVTFVERTAAFLAAKRGERPHV
ncbi:hypothetical protein [Bosea sp. AS-1]|nr:hypothetical protein [Bosea sp. AS-1]